MIFEVDALLRVDENGIVIAEGLRDAWVMRLDEWLRTPAGSVYGLPHWGNPMEEFKHEPFGSDTSSILEVAIEARLLRKLRTDLPGLSLQAIRCTAISIDQMQMTFHAGGEPYSVIMKNNRSGE